MLLLQLFATMTNVEVAHFSPDSARIEAPTTANAATMRNFGEHGISPLRQALRGE
jgi:hypothetical protein